VEEAKRPARKILPSSGTYQNSNLSKWLGSLAKVKFWHHLGAGREPKAFSA
jgi:hypothetical protein